MTSKIAIIDASIAIKAILPNPLQGHCRALLQTFADVQPVAPALWVYETTSAISKAVYFEQLTETDTQVESVALDRRAYSVDLINILNS